MKYSRSLIFVVSIFALSNMVISSVHAADVPEGSWPDLRGPDDDGAVRDGRLFEAGGGDLSVTWQRDLGSGYPVVTVDESRAVTAFQSGDVDVVAAFNRESGAELWRYNIGEAHKGHTGSHDGPIATPTLVDGRVFGVGPRGHFFALDATSGEALWTLHLVEDFAAVAPFYGFATSPIVADGVVIVQIGAGEGKSVAGFSAESGDLMWSAGDDKVDYQSPILATLGDREQIVVAGATQVSGIDPASGDVLWTFAHGGDKFAMGGSSIVPIPAGQDRILLLSEHPQSLMLEIEESEDGDWKVTELWKSADIKATYVQPVYFDGYLYGMNSKIFTCVDAASGKTVWRSRQPGDGFPTLVGDQLAIMSKPGILRIVKATPEGYQELASLELFDEVSWSAPAYAGGSLYLRSMGAIARVDVTFEENFVSQEGSSSAAGDTGFAAFLAEIEQLGSAESRRARVDSYLGAHPQMPLVEDGGAVHFLFSSKTQDVGIVGDMIGFRREDPMIRIADTDLFYYSTRLESDAAVLYGFLVDYGDAIPDPRNPHAGSGLFGEVSFLEMPARVIAEYSTAAVSERQGRLEDVTWESAAFEGKTRSARVYLPAGYDERGATRYPTLYFHEGEDALEKADFKNVLDHLIDESVRPLVVVFVVGDKENERGEFRNPAYSKMVLEELIPLIDRSYLTIDDPMARASAGEGGGAEFSLRLAFGSPDRVARIGVLWPILFGFDGVPPEADESPLVIYQRWGAYHFRSPHENFDSAVYNRKLQTQLREAGHRPSGGEVPEGLGWNCARGYVPEMLRVLFPLI